MDRSGTSLGATVGEGYFSLVRLIDNAGAGDGATHVTLQAPDISASYTLTLPTDDGTANQALITDGSGALSWSSVPALVSGLDWDSVWTDAVHTHQSDAEGGTLDHGAALTGLTDDDHTQYVLLAGRATGQTILGGTASGDDLVLNSTSHATKGDVSVQTDGGNFIIGGGTTASRLRMLEASGSGTNYTEFVTQPQAGNITYTLPPDDGDADEVLSTDGSGSLTWVAQTGGGFTLGTEQASTSGTAIDFTGIPAGTKMIVVTWQGVRINGTSNFRIQIGDSGGIEDTGYLGSGSHDFSDGTGDANGTAGFDFPNPAATIVRHGLFLLVLSDSADNTWVCIGASGRSDAAVIGGVAGSKASLDSALTQLRITSASGDTFDAGSINISYS